LYRHGQTLIHLVQSYQKTPIVAGDTLKLILKHSPGFARFISFIFIYYHIY
jgi:hypothetical protein